MGGAECLLKTWFYSILPNCFENGLEKSVRIFIIEIAYDNARQINLSKTLSGPALFELNSRYNNTPYTFSRIKHFFFWRKSYKKFQSILDQFKYKNRYTQNRRTYVPVVWETIWNVLLFVININVLNAFAVTI